MASRFLICRIHDQGVNRQQVAGAGQDADLGSEGGGLLPEAVEFLEG